MAIFQRAWPGSGRSGRTGVPSRAAVRLETPTVPAVVPGASLVPGASHREAARALIWGLETGGWTEREAGNLVALLTGLRPARTGWSEHEIEHLRFLRALVDTGRLDH